MYFSKANTVNGIKNILRFRNYKYSFIFLVSIVSNITAQNSDYESQCGEVALSCISNCQVFKHKCGGSYVAEVIKNSKPGTVSNYQGSITPSFTNIISSGGSSNSIIPKYQEDCKTQGQVCAVTREYERSECCPGHFCVPFERRNGHLVTIGSCNLLNYRDKINPRIVKKP